jgi:hypothetical protein
MRPDQYRAAAALANGALLRPRVHPQLVDRVTGSERNAVYVICDRTGAIRYVGSTVGRPARARIVEHLNDVNRTREWHEVWVIPLRASTPEVMVRAIEGRVGRFLRPCDSHCLPRSREA